MARIVLIVSLILFYMLGQYSLSNALPHWIISIWMLLFFAAMVLAMYMRLLPALVVLPIMAVALAAMAGVKWEVICSDVIQDGSVRLAKWIMAAILGATLGQIVEKTGIAQTAIKNAAELGGDKPFILTVVLTLVIAVLFTTIGGLGAVIMVASIVIPILLSLGLRPLYVGCVFLLAMSLGGAFNLTNWQFYMTELGMTQKLIFNFAAPFAGMMFIFILIFLIIEGKRMGKAKFKAEIDIDDDHPKPPAIALLTPVIPLIPIILSYIIPKIRGEQPYDFPVIAALLMGIVYGAITAVPWRKNSVQLLTKCAFDGVTAVGPAIILMIGIGMVLKATMNPDVTQYITPYVQSVLPTGVGFGDKMHYVILFTLLAPLALYRGPMNLYGMGAPLMGILKPLLPPGAIMGAFMSVGMIQGVCDPTNTHNVWVANYTNTDVQDILKRTIPYMWGLAVLGLIMSAVAFFW